MTTLGLADLEALAAGLVASAEHGALLDDGVLVIGVDHFARLSDDDAGVCTTRLRELSAVVIAVADDQVAPVWADVVAGPDELTELVSAVSAQRLAAVTLAGVLRASEQTDVAAGLAIESLAYSTLQAGPDYARWLAGRTAAGRANVSTPAVQIDRAVVDGHDTLAVTLNRPEVHNAFSAAMRTELVEAMELALAEPELRVELRGAGPSFSSGGDLSEFGSSSDPATAHVVRLTSSPALLAGRLADRTVVHLHGAVAGAGIELSAWAQRIIAAPDTSIWLPELALGLIPGAGGTVSLPRRIGRHRTMLLALTGRRLGADEALAWGLIDELADAPKKGQTHL